MKFCFSEGEELKPTWKINKWRTICDSLTSPPAPAPSDWGAWLPDLTIFPAHAPQGNGGVMFSRPQVLEAVI